MDFVPILILTSAAALSYWRRVLGTWRPAIAYFLLVALSGRALGLFLHLERSVQISLGYISAALTIVVPLTLLVQRSRWNGITLLLGIVLSFATAVAFRLFDRPGATSPLPMGTHFLWHAFGGLAVWLLMLLTMRLDDARAD
jgi:hemolysin III